MARTDIVSDDLRQPLFEGDGGERHRLPVALHLGNSRYRFARLASNVTLWVCYLVLAVLSSLVVWQVATRSAGISTWAWVVAAIFVNISVPLALYDINMHMIHYVRPHLQRYYIRWVWHAGRWAGRQCVW